MTDTPYRYKVDEALRTMSGMVRVVECICRGTVCAHDLYSSARPMYLLESSTVTADSKALRARSFISHPSDSR